MMPIFIVSLCFDGWLSPAVVFRRLLATLYTARYLDIQGLEETSNQRGTATTP